MPRGIYERKHKPRINKAGREAIKQAQKARWAKYKKQKEQSNVEAIVSSLKLPENLKPFKMESEKFKLIENMYTDATSYASFVEAYFGGFIDGYKARRDEE